MSKTKVPPELRQKVAAAAQYRCGYCQTQEIVVGMPMVVDHIIPEAKGGPTAEENLWLACRRCNEFKGVHTEFLDSESQERVPLFHPRRQQWRDHFAWTADGLYVVGITAIGRATVVALQLNNDYSVRSRRRWVRVGWHPPGND